MFTTRALTKTEASTETKQQWSFKACFECTKLAAEGLLDGLTEKLRQETLGQLWISPYTLNQLGVGTPLTGKVAHVYRRNGRRTAVLHVGDKHVEVPYDAEEFCKHARQTPFASEAAGTLPAKSRKTAQCATFFVNPFLTDGEVVKVDLDVGSSVELDGAVWFEVLRHSAVSVSAELFCHVDEKSQRLFLPAVPPFCGLVFSPSKFNWAHGQTITCGVSTYSDLYKAVAKKAPEAYARIFSALSPCGGAWICSATTDVVSVADAHSALKTAASMISWSEITPLTSDDAVKQTLSSSRVYCLCIGSSKPSYVLFLSDDRLQFTTLECGNLETGSTFTKSCNFNRDSLRRHLERKAQGKLGVQLQVYDEKAEVPSTDVPWLVCDEPGRAPPADATFMVLLQGASARLERWFAAKQPVGVYSVTINAQKVDYLVSLDFEKNCFLSTRIRVGGKQVDTRVVRVLQRGTKPVVPPLKYPAFLSKCEVMYHRRAEIDSKWLFGNMVHAQTARVRLPRQFEEAFPQLRLDGSACRVKVDLSNPQQKQAVSPFLNDFCVGMHAAMQPTGRFSSVELRQIRDVTVYACVNPTKVRQFECYATAVALELRADGELRPERLNLATCFHGTRHELIDGIVTSPFGLLPNAPVKNARAYGPGLYLSRISSRYCVPYCTGTTSRRSMLLCVAALGVSQQVCSSTGGLGMRSDRKMRPFRSGWAGGSQPNVYTVAKEEAVLPLLQIEFTLCPGT